MPRRRRTRSDELQGIAALGLLLLIVFALKYPGALWFFIIIGIVIQVLVVVVQRNKRARFFQEQDTLMKLRSLNPNQFEEYIVDLFQRLGYKTEGVGGSYDGGIDVIAEKNGIKHYI